MGLIVATPQEIARWIMLEWTDRVTEYRDLTIVARRDDTEIIFDPCAMGRLEIAPDPTETIKGTGFWLYVFMEDKLEPQSFRMYGNTSKEPTEGGDYERGVARPRG